MSLYGGQLALSTLLIMLNYPVIFPTDVAPQFLWKLYPFNIKYRYVPSNEEKGTWSYNTRLARNFSLFPGNCKWATCKILHIFFLLVSLGQALKKTGKLTLCHSLASEKRGFCVDLSPCLRATRDSRECYILWVRGVQALRLFLALLLVTTKIMKYRVTSAYYLCHFCLGYSCSF